MLHNFTARDISALLPAFVLFGLFLVIPGYVLGAWMNLFAFRVRTFPARIAISLCLSIAVVPVGTCLCGLAAPRTPWLFCAACGAAFPWAAFPGAAWKARRPGSGTPSKPRLAVLTILAAWLIVGAACLVDLQIGHRLYVPVVSYDYMLRAAVTSAIERTGVPPVNPLFYPGHACVLRYHYFWYMLCAMVARLGPTGITARIAVIAGTLWSGVALVAAIALYSHFFRPTKNPRADRRMLVATALLGVTGLDILPLALRLLFTGRFDASSEWWNEPVLSWVNSVFWQPHSIAALVACLTGLLVVRHAARASPWRARIAAAAVGGAALASGLGLSIYVTLVFAVFWMAWIVILLVRTRRAESALMLMAGLAALGLSIPFVRELAAGAGGGGAHALPVSFAIRSFYFAEALVGTGTGAWWRIPLANALSLPLNYFLEFGFFFAVGIRQGKRIREHRPISDEDACWLTMFAASLIVCTFFRSHSISNNDLGWRGIVIAQFVLLMAASELVGRYGKALTILLALGAAATLYDVAMLRIYPVLLDDLAIPRYHWLAPDHRLGERTYALREIYQRLRRDLPPDAVVQQNPDTNPGDLFSGLYADRQTAADTRGCGAVFGGSAQLCAEMLPPIEAIFNGNPTAAQVDLVCHKYSIAALVVKDTDPVWKNKSSWVWTQEPLLHNLFARTYVIR